MTVALRLDQFLKTNRVPYEVIPHTRTDTSVQTAKAENVPSNLFAKAVMVKANGKHVMVVLPANHSLDLLKLEQALGTHDLEVEHERDFRDLFIDCDLGALHPFGTLYDIPTYLDVRMTVWPEIFFCAGDHEEGIQMRMYDYLRLAKATVVDIAA